MRSFQKSPPVLDRDVTAFQIYMTFADRFDLGTEQYDTGLIFIKDLVVENGLLVLVNDLQYNTIDNNC